MGTIEEATSFHKVGLKKANVQRNMGLEFDKDLNSVLKKLNSFNHIRHSMTY